MVWRADLWVWLVELPVVGVGVVGCIVYTKQRLDNSVSLVHALNFNPCIINMGEIEK